MNETTMEEFEGDSSTNSDLTDICDGYISNQREIVEDLVAVNLLSDKSSPISVVLDHEVPKIKPRAYQSEMLAESVEKNVVVTMDTGSGKTHIAVLRILHELDNMGSKQLIWFLAPTVDLCAQQHEYISTQISTILIKFLSGADDVDRWTEQTHWDSILKNVKIVVSTYQILLDALTHGFVKIETLSLIVFDEAHNCVGKSPGSKIMHNFYHPRKQQGREVPRILGLTASPVMRSNPQSLTKIEETLDAICRTPTKHRAELRLQVKFPVLSQRVYDSSHLPNPLAYKSKAVEDLSNVASALKLNIMEDPYVLSLLKEGSDISIARARKVCLSGKTWCQNQLKAFIATSRTLASELGASAADYYVQEVISRYVTIANARNDLSVTWGVSTLERDYLAKALMEIETRGNSNNGQFSFAHVSDKVSKLIEVLVEEPEGFSGIVFVQERAAAAVLAQLLTDHPSTRGRFKVGTMVGSSSSTKRGFNMGELVDLKGQKDVLALFKSGIINLIVATSVLEEGIDVPACNLVICFQQPSNLKSFVQRRGRARHRDSKLILLLDSLDNKLSQWQQLELEMKRIYENEMRSLQEVLYVEDTETHNGQTFRVESTQALLELDNALQHLYHFCATLPRADCVDPRPEFICHTDESKLIRAKVILPLSVNESVRYAESRSMWKSERIAIKDAAFEAYVALYRAGLVNDNLLPLLRHDPIADDLMSSAIETRASLMMVNDQSNPWVKIAELSVGTPNMYHSTIICNGVELAMFLPKPHFVRPFKVYWDAKTEFMVHVEHTSDTTAATAISKASSDTWSILEASFGARFPVQQQGHAVLFSALLDPRPLHSLLGRKAYEYPGHESSGLIRDSSCLNIPYIFQGYLEARPPKDEVQQVYEDHESCPSEVPHLSLKRLPKRLDFLHEIPTSNSLPSSKLHSTVLPVSRCIVDEMPFEYVQFGLLIPSIIRRLEISLLADVLSTTLLQSVQIRNSDLITTAISASSARESSNYQRLEFIGDSVLKMCTSIQLMGEYPLWHEGYLSAMKDRLVANSRLSRAAVEVGLDKFIVTKPFTGHKWRPLYIDDLLQFQPGRRREMSSKVLADVVEALIGAAMVDGGIEKALKCLQTFLPEMVWQPLETRRLFLFRRVPEVVLPITLQPLEQLIGYQFQKKALLIEAMTLGSYDRLEFLGDSILDRIVVGELEEHNDKEGELTHVQMHLFRTALVNADFLAFLCMEWAVQQERIDIQTDPTPNGTPTLTERKSTVSFALWRFMRHHTPRLGLIQAETTRRHAVLRDDINAAMETGSHYPWALLARLQAMKFYSDIVESLIGAVWIDSGSFGECIDVVEEMGVLPYLRRLLRDGVHLWHPKEELGRLADDKTVRYCVGVVENDDVEGRGVEKDGSFWCRVFVDEKLVVEVVDGLGKDEVMTRAAEKAVEVLKIRKGNAGDDVGDKMDLDEE